MFLYVDDNNFLTLFYSGPPDKLRKLFESARRHSVDTRQIGSTNLDRNNGQNQTGQICGKEKGERAGSHMLNTAVCYGCKKTWALVPVLKECCMESVKGSNFLFSTPGNSWSMTHSTGRHHLLRSAF